MSKEETKTKPTRNRIVSWTINVKWDNGTYENISDMDDDISLDKLFLKEARDNHLSKASTGGLL